MKRRGFLGMSGAAVAARSAVKEVAPVVAAPAPVAPVLAPPVIAHNWNLAGDCRSYSITITKLGPFEPLFPVPRRREIRIGNGHGLQQYGGKK